jgi:colanic acid/amylovoran biosynthesis glycosyltransferase
VFSFEVNVPVVAYIANEFPSPLEPYVEDEIRELLRRGVRVVTCTGKAPRAAQAKSIHPELSLLPMSWLVALQALWLCVRSVPQLWDLWARVLFEGHESLSRRLRCLVHTWFGAYYAVLLRPSEIDHIHAHHGYFASWVALVAARLLNVGFSLTLHGSDLLVHGHFLDTKLTHCDFCLTISEYNRGYILKKFPNVPPSKILVQHLGVNAADQIARSPQTAVPPRCMVLLSVGRLHTVKNHAFLIDACARLRERGMDVFCLIAGDGPERQWLQRKIASLGLDDRVTLLGHIPRKELDPLYALADLVVLTSHSEGIPLVLMEAMMRGKLVLAPAITGIPELVEDGRTGFLFQPGSLDDFVARVQWLQCASPLLEEVRRAARDHALAHFERQSNLHAFGDVFLARMRKIPAPIYESPVLQQI